MNKKCLYCYQALEESQVDFHVDCAMGFFGCESAPSSLADLGEQYLIKRGEQGVYTPELEAVTMRLAQAALILTIPNTLFRDDKGDLIFLAKEDKTAETLDKFIEGLDGCVFDGSAEMIAELVEDFSSISRLDLVTFYEQLIFGWVIGCSSMSLSSFAFSRPNAGVCSLSAIYDLYPTLSNTEEELSLEINGKRKNIRRSDFEASMKFMGLKDRIIRITIEKLLKAKEQWSEIIERSELSGELKRAYFSQISSRLKILER